MELFRNRRIRTKLKLIAMASACSALLLACLAFVINDIISYRAVMLKDLTIRAEIIGQNSTAALSFGDPKPVEEIMSALRADPHLVAACVFGKENQVLAEFRRPGFTKPFPNRPAKSEARFTPDSLQVFGDIVFNGETIGSVFLQSDLRGLRSRVLVNATITALVMLAAMCVAFLLADRLQRFISDPLTELAGIAGRIARDRDYSLRATKKHDDEIGWLVEGFNEMLVQIQDRDSALRQSQEDLENRVDLRTRELSESNQTLSQEIDQRKRSQQEMESMQQQLIDTSRQAGMAEIATGVLHNVGNVLNSVNVSSNLVIEQLRKSKIASLAKAVQLLSAHKDDVGEFLTADPKGKQLPGFLEALSEHLAREQAGMTRELQGLQTNIEHIKQIVAMQQSYAKVSGALEILPPCDLVEDALRMASSTLARHHIEVVREFEPVPPVLVDRHKVLQILVNLVSNSIHALREIPSRQKRLTLQVSLIAPERVKIVVKDNGVGIAPENLTRIFGHGFTTKKDGHGFGLHSGALAVKEMGGTISVRSEGLGKGAEFILELPARQNVQAAA